MYIYFNKNDWNQSHSETHSDNKDRKVSDK